MAVFIKDAAVRKLVQWEIVCLNMKTLIVVLVAVTAYFAHAQEEDLDLSTLVPLCSRNDPKFDDCILRAVDQVTPTLKTGIPQLEVPALDPMYLDEVVINPNGGSFRAVGKGITVKGLTDFKVVRFKSDLEHNTFYMSVEFPFVEYHGKYELNLPTPMIRIKGSGPIHGNATNLRANGVLEGKVVKRGSESFYQFKTLDLDVKVGDYKVNFRGMFPDKFLDEMAMNLINERSAEFSWTVEPLAERAASSVILAYADRIVRHLPIEKLFP